MSHSNDEVVYLRDVIETLCYMVDDDSDGVEEVMQLRTIDLVRCKECKHNYNKVLNHGKMHPRCDFTDWKLSESDYCSRGEREGE